jgi:hypothetical protein
MALQTRVRWQWAIPGLWVLACGACGPQYKPLFDGKTLNGWKAVGNAVWKVEDGCLVGTQDAQKRAGDLVHEAEFDDFELTATFKVVWPANSGIWFRWDGANIGYQFDILEWKNPEAYTGTIYCPGLPDGKLFLTEVKDKTLTNYEGWNTVHLSAVGDHITATLNGKPVADVRNDRLKKGHIGIQVHAGDEFKDMKIIIKDIRVREVGKGRK